MKVYGQSFLLAIVVFAVYAQTFSFEFLRFDDQDYTFLCPFVKDGLSWVNVKAAFCSFRHAAIWMPLTYLSYMLDISVFGPGMVAHHLVNAAVHAVNSVLFYWLLTGMFAGMRSNGAIVQADDGTPGQGGGRTRLIILGATLFWALHPMRVEPVAWIAGRKELLCAFFVLLGLLAIVKREAVRETRDVGRAFPNTSFLLILLCCLAACMSKPTGMCFPFLAFCVAAMVRTGNGERGMWNGTVLTIATLPIAFATGLIAVYSQTHAEGYDVRTLFTAPFAVRALNAVKSLGLYIFKTFVPFDLHIDCRWPSANLPADGWGTILTAVAGLSILLLWVVAAGRAASPLDDIRRPSGRIALFSLLFFLFAVAPTLGVFGSFGREARADRFTYIPTMAISMLLVAALLKSGKVERLKSGSGEWANTLVCLVLVAMMSCHFFITLRLIPTFRNDYTAFSRVLACDPVHPRALSHVASEECARLKDFDSGIRHFRDSLACEWNHDTACQLAFALATRGRKEDVSDIRALGESTGVAKRPESDRKGLMAEALGMAALKDGRWRDAVAFFSAAVRAPARLYPADDAFARLGVALANGGRRKEAEQVFSALARPGAARESVRAFAERSLEQIAASRDGRVMLFY